MEELLIEHYVKDLLGVQRQNPGTHNSLQQLYNSLESKLRALENLGAVRDKLRYFTHLLNHLFWMIFLEHGTDTNHLTEDCQIDVLIWNRN